MRRALLWAQQLLAGGAILWGGITLAAALERVPRFGPRNPTELVIASLLGLAPIFFGVAWTFFVQRGLAAETEAEEERAVVSFALKNGGIASALTASVGTGLAVKSADRVLRRLQREGHAELDVSEAGALVYRFPSLLAEASRLAAQPSAVPSSTADAAARLRDTSPDLAAVRTDEAPVAPRGKLRG